MFIWTDRHHLLEFRMKVFQFCLHTLPWSTDWLPSSAEQMESVLSKQTVVSKAQQVLQILHAKHQDYCTHIIIETYCVMLALVPKVISYWLTVSDNQLRWTAWLIVSLLLCCPTHLKSLNARDWVQLPLLCLSILISYFTCCKVTCKLCC